MQQELGCALGRLEELTAWPQQEVSESGGRRVLAAN